MTDSLDTCAYRNKRDAEEGRMKNVMHSVRACPNCETLWCADATDQSKFDWYERELKRLQNELGHTRRHLEQADETLYDLRKSWDAFLEYTGY